MKMNCNCSGRCFECWLASLASLLDEIASAPEGPDATPPDYENPVDAAGTFTG